MLKLCHIYFTAFGLCLTGATNADEQRYIFDDLLTYIHSGLGDQYCIVGTLNSGDAVTLIGQNDNASFAQVRDERVAPHGSCWTSSAYSPAGAPRAPALEQ